MTDICIICEQPMVPRNIATRRFCSTECRKIFHDGCRRISAQLFEKGVITADQIREAGTATEYVPGWLSMPDNAFGCFLAALVAASEEAKRA
jgi:predicted nucleic acid-binding Zn ribbon protein